MKLGFLFCIGLTFSIISCGNKEGDNVTDNAPNKELLTEDSKMDNDEVDDRRTSLPITSGMELITEEYVVSEILTEIQSTYDASQSLKIVMSDDEELILEISYSGASAEESYQLNIGDFNSYGTEIKLEFADVNQDGVSDELVIWWNTMNGNNGIIGGFEEERSGIMIFNVTQREVVLGFCYLDWYSSYESGVNADMDDENYHAKMDDNSIWEICSYTMDISLKDGLINLGPTQIESEGMDNCSPNTYLEGSYVFNLGTGFFELID